MLIYVLDEMSQRFSSVRTSSRYRAGNIIQSLNFYLNIRMYSHARQESPPAVMAISIRNMRTLKEVENMC